MSESRRTFLKLSALTAATVLGGRALVETRGLSAETEIPVTTGSSTYMEKTPSPSLTQSLPTKTELKSSSTPTPDVWKLSLAQQVEFMSKSESFRELQGENTNKIIKFQFDNSEYVGMDKEVFRRNTCSQATLATATDLCGFLETGNVFGTKIADIYRDLNGKEFTDVKGFTAKYITWNDSMYFVAMPEALKLLMPQYISKVEFLTPNYGARYGRIVPQMDWPNILSKAQIVCKNGGFCILGGIKYGYGHTVLATDVKEDGTAIIVDSRSYKDLQQGTAQRVFLKKYFERWVDSEAEYLGKQLGLLHVFGITRKLNTSN